jgi:plastocyanin
MRARVKAERTRRISAIFAVALGLSFAGIAPADAAGAAKGATHTVVIDGVRFEPDALTVKAGDTIVWVNKDPFPHTVTSQAGGFDSREIPAGKSWRYTPTKAGMFAYVCTLHTTMKATLKVE